MSELTTSSKGPSYRNARDELAKSAGRIRLYGVELEKPDDDATLVIWFCGYSVGTADHRAGSKRIFHVPRAAIAQHGTVDGFTYENCQVHWFDVDAHARLVEESFVGFDAGVLAAPPPSDAGRQLTALERLHGFGWNRWLPIWGTVGDVPIIIPLEPPTTNPVPVIIPLNPPTPNPVPVIIPLG